MKTVMMFCLILWCSRMCSFPTDKSRAITTQANVRLLETCVKEFEKTSGRLPTREEGLNVLIHKPLDWPESKPWTELLETTDLPRDGWGHDFVCVLDPNLPHGFGIYSCGQDGVTATNGNDRDDINTWAWNDYYRVQAQRKAMMCRAVSLAIVLPITAAVVLILWKGFRPGRQPAS